MAVRCRSQAASTLHRSLVPSWGAHLVSHLATIARRSVYGCLSIAALRSGRDGEVASAESGRRAAATLALPILVSIAICGCGLSKPGTLIQPDAVGVIVSTERTAGRLVTAHLDDRSIEIDTGSALDLYGPGIGPDMLLLYGDDGGRTWYLTSALAPPLGREDSPPRDCYPVTAGAAFDDPDAVIFVFGAWRDVGLRLRKRADFDVPASLISPETGRYRMGVEGTEGGPFCVDPDGFVFGIPWP